MMKPWVNDELRAEIEKKHAMHSASRKSGNPDDFEAFKLQRNKVTNMLRAAKLEYIGMHPEEVRERSAPPEEQLGTGGSMFLPRREG